MSDAAILQVAVNDVHSEGARGVPLGPQKSFEQALEDAEKNKKIVQTHFSQKGGRARKSDELRDLIDEIVRGNPNIDVHQLVLELKGERGVGRVTIDGGSDYLPNDRREIHIQNGLAIHDRNGYEEKAKAE